MESVTTGEGNAPTEHRDSSWERRSGGDAIRWLVSGDVDDLVLGAAGLDWFDLGGDSRAELIKSNPRREIYRLAIGGRLYYVKSFRAPTLRDRVRSILQGSPAHREWKAARRATAGGIPCPRFVAMGAGAGREWLVSEHAPGATILADAWLRAEAIPDAAERRRCVVGIIEAAALLLATAHRTGFVHGDDHPHNILTTGKAAVEFQALYVDLVNVRFFRRVARRRAVESLAQLHQWFRWRASRAERLRFLRSYLRLRGVEGQGQGSLRFWATDVVRATRVQAARLWAKRDGRIGVANAYFARLQPRPDVAAWVALRGDRGDVDGQAPSVERSTEQWRRTLADSQGGVEPAPPAFLAQVDRLPGRRWTWRRIVRQTDVGRRFVLGHRLRNRHVPSRCPAALLIITSPAIGVETRVWFEAQPRTVSLVAFASDQAISRGKRKRMVTSLAKLVARMADCGAFVRCASATTFAVAVEGDAVIIDDPLAVMLGETDARRCALETVRALRGLLGSDDRVRRTDVVRFLRGLDRRRWKSIWRQAISTGPHALPNWPDGGS